MLLKLILKWDTNCSWVSFDCFVYWVKKYSMWKYVAIVTHEYGNDDDKNIPPGWSGSSSTN